MESSEYVVINENTNTINEEELQDLFNDKLATLIIYLEEKLKKEKNESCGNAS